MKITRYPDEFDDYWYSLKVEFTDQEDEPCRGDMVFVMFNPATVREASYPTDESRTRRWPIDFAIDSGNWSVTKVNLFAYRARKKEQLLKMAHKRGVNPVGPGNDRGISESVQSADLIVVGWGMMAGNPLLRKSAFEVSELLKGSEKQFYCIGINQDGSPIHPAARERSLVQQWPLTARRLPRTTPCQAEMSPNSASKRSS